MDSDAKFLLLTHQLSFPEMLLEISQWKPEARDEDNARYFYPFPSLASVIKGEKIIISGRKGSGKTAVLTHIESLSSWDTHATRLTLADVVETALDKLPNDGLLRRQRSIDLWKFVILNAILDQMTGLPNISEGVSSVLDARRPKRPERQLKFSVERWRTSSFEIGVGDALGGPSLAVGRSPVQNNSNISDQIRIMEDIILGEKITGRHYILFDELDIGIGYASKLSDEWNKYNDIIGGLIAACLDMKRNFSHKNIHTIVFIRDDLFNEVIWQDKGKWSPFVLELRWSIGEIRNLLAHRLSRAIDRDCVKDRSFSDIWSNLFSRSNVFVTSKRSGARSIQIIDYIKQRSFSRPRDFISYLQKCAEFTMKGGGTGKISPDAVILCEYDYSKGIRQEAIDEISFRIPDIDKIFSLFDTLNTGRHFNFEAFDRRVVAAQEDGRVGNAWSSEMILEMLFKYSIVGNARKYLAPNSEKEVWYRTFYYVKPTSNLQLKRLMTVHSSLYSALFPSTAEVQPGLANELTNDEGEPTPDLIERK